MAAVRRTDGSAYELSWPAEVQLVQPDMALDLKEIQGNIAAGFKKDFARFHLLAPPDEPSLAPAYRRRCRPPPNAGPGRRPGPHPEGTAAQAIQPLHDLRQPKPALLPVAADARRRQGLLACRHPSRACPMEPPLSHRARNDDRLHDPDIHVKTVYLQCPKGGLAGLAVGPTAIAGKAAAVEEAGTERVMAGPADGRPGSPVNPDKSTLGSRQAPLIRISFTSCAVPCTSEPPRAQDAEPNSDRARRDHSNSSWEGPCQ